MSAHVNILPSFRKTGPIAGIVAFSVFILWASLKKVGNGVSIEHIDKVFHFGIYALLAVFACWVWPKVNGWKIWLGSSLYGGLMELCQGYFTQGRTPSLADALANALGAAIAVILYRYWIRYRRAKA